MEENQVIKPQKRKTSPFAWFLLLGIIVVPNIGFLVSTQLLAPIQSAREAGRRATCMSNLRNIELALHNYHEKYDRFPPAYTVDPEGKPLHSWRTLLLPFIERSDIYEQIKLDEPWDSPDNLAIFKNQNIRLYECLNCPELNRDAKTIYVMVTGPNYVSDGPNSCSIEDLKGKTGEVIHLIETTSPVHWYEPKDLKADEITFKVNDATTPGIGSWHPGFVVAAFCDGHVEAIDEDIAPEKLRSMFEIKKGSSWKSVFDDFHEKASE